MAKWQPWEVKFLQDKYLIFSLHEIAKALGRSYDSVRNKRRTACPFEEYKTRRAEKIRTMVRAGLSTGEIAILMRINNRHARRLIAQAVKDHPGLLERWKANRDAAMSRYAHKKIDYDTVRQYLMEKANAL